MRRSWNGLGGGVNIDAKARMRYANTVAKDTMDRAHGELDGVH